MSRILTPNVFITNSEKLVKDFFLGGTYKNVDELPDVPDALVISGKTNKYLQSLEYSVNFDSENNPCLTLEFLDTDGNFEQSFFMHLVNSGKTMLQQVFKDDNRKQLQQTFLSRDTSSGGASFDIVNGSIEVKESELVNIAQYANQYNRIFIAFGTDNILANWSDVMGFYLNKTTVDISNGLRKYVFKFFASNDSIFRPRLKFNFENPNPSREFLYLDSVDKLIIDVPINKSIDNTENVLYRCVKKYLSIITRTPESNIIGIIPKLGFLTSYKLNSLAPFDRDSRIAQAAQADQFARNQSFLTNRSDINLSFLNKLGISKQNKFKAYESIANRLKIPAGISPTPLAADAQRESNNSVSTIDSYVLQCDKLDSSVNPGFPDFYDALNKINIGIKAILNTVDNFVIFQENNTKILNYWKSIGLIGINTDTIEKCIIFGLEQMVSEYLYRNYIPVESETAKTFEEYLNILTNDFKPTIPIYGSDSNAYDKLYSKDGTEKNNVAKILLNPKYGSDLVTLMSKRKISSNFLEQINIDELSIDNDKLSTNFVNLFKTKGGLLELFEIPVFLNNFTNGNILNIQFVNSEVYLAGVKLAIDSNFNKAYLAAITNNVNQVNINGLNLKSVFDEYAKILKDSKLGKDFKEVIKKVLTQQLYLAKEQEITLVLDEYTIEQDTYVISPIDVRLKRKSIFTQLKNIKPKPRTILVEGAGTETDFARVELEPPQDTENRIRKNIGFFINQNEVIKIIEKLENLFIGLDNLIFKHMGNLNIDSLLLSLAASRANPNAGKGRENPYTDQIRKKEIRIDSDFDALGFDFNEQEAYFNLANTLFTIFDIKTLDDPSPAEGVVFKPKEFGLSQENIASELWNSLNSQQIKLSIKTLPFFHLSSFRLVNFKPCFVFSKQVTPININSLDNSPKLDFFSGVYNIAAFKHVINTKECYSQFMLLKNIGNAYAL